jgi:hypothetical protein
MATAGTLTSLKVPVPASEILIFEPSPNPLESFMKKLLLPLSLALAPVFAVSAFAQTRGEADPAQSKGQTLPKASAEEKALAKSARRAEGAVVAKTKKTEADADPSPAGVARTVSKEERAASRAKRRAETALAVKRGEIPRPAP